MEMVRYFAIMHIVNLQVFLTVKKFLSSRKRDIYLDIGDWSKTQNLLEKGHQYLFRDKDGDARETLSRKSNRPRFEDITVKGCYEGDSCKKNNR